MHRPDSLLRSQQWVVEPSTRLAAATPLLARIHPPTQEAAGGASCTAGEGSLRKRSTAWGPSVVPTARR
jgi:hypothetical protein